MKSNPSVIQSCKDLKIYALSFDLAMKLFELTRNFPREEQYSLIDQIRRFSRSIPANIREGFAKRKYENVFIKHLNDALGSSEETRTWLEFSRNCGYISNENFKKIDQSYHELGAMIYTLMNKWQAF